MAKPSAQRTWPNWGWIAGWSRLERIIVACAWLLPIVVLAGGRDWGWLSGLFALAAFGVLNIVVHRHGGWHLLGPHFYYDVVRLARRGRSTALRVVYILAMFIGLTFVYNSSPTRQHMDLNEFAHISERFAYALFVVQNAAIMVLTPAYLASAIAEEKERRTLELLFTTHLSNAEIVLGKLTSRIIHLIGFVLAGFPILSLIQFWGGIDMLLIVGNLVNTLLNIITLGSMCLLASVLAKTVAGAVMTCYAIVLPPGFCCMFTLRGFPFVLQDARSGGAGNVTVQDLGVLFVVHMVVTGGFLALAIVALRDKEPIGLAAPPRPIDPTMPPDGRARPAPNPAAIQAKPILTTRSADAPAARAKAKPQPETADLFAVPYSLPPVSDEPLLWKERFVGGPPLIFSPIVLVPAGPFLVSGFLIMAFWFLRALWLSGEEYARTVETWALILKFFYYLFLGCYVFGVAWRAGASIARERQQQTLEPLLLLPIDRREILTAKLLGCLMRGWPWLALLGAVIALGTLIGAFHPFSAVLLALAPWPLIFFIATLGLLLSIALRTVMRANLVMVMAPLLLMWCSSNGFEAFTFSMTRMPADDERRLAGVFAGCLLSAAYLLAALVCWRIALAMFENRSSQADSV
jgi:ABC-type transport system involved in multi-copper enzyme maturation permease subunit